MKEIMAELTGETNSLSYSNVELYIFIILLFFFFFKLHLRFLTLCVFWTPINRQKRRNCKGKRRLHAHVL